jgi:hypothetical protein
MFACSVSCSLLQALTQLCAVVSHLLAHITHVSPLLRDLQEYDFPTCDLLLVMGTSLVVHPFASLIGESLMGSRCTSHTWALASCALFGPCLVPSLHRPQYQCGSSVLQHAGKQ